MEKYSALEQAVNDPSLAVISDQTKTLKELNRVYFKYKTLPRQQRRFSDYYSNLFLGHTNIWFPSRTFTTGKKASIPVKQTSASFSDIRGAENP